MARSPKSALTLTLAVAALVLSACGGKSPPPGPGTVRGTPPDLRGRRVIVLPIQQSVGVGGNLNAELVFGLTDRTREVGWVFAPEVDEILARSPSISARTTGLAVGHFLLAEVQRVGDPLFGELRRMAALVDATAILIPIQAALVSVPGEDPKINLTAALIEARTGRVAWFVIVEGGAFPAGDPRGIASAVDALARRLLWYVGQ